MRAFVLCFISTFSILSLLGCSTSMPLSETYMFTEKKVASNELYTNNDSLSWRTTKGTALSLNTQSTAIKQYISKRHATEGYPDPHKFGFAFSSATNEGSFAWGYNIGYKALGLNATLGIVGNNYLTLNAGIAGGGEVILQHKVYQHSATGTPGGMAIGAFIKRDYFGYDEKSTSLADIYSTATFVPVDLYGARGMFHFRFFHEAMVHGFVSVGHAPQLDTQILNIGITVGADIFE